MLTTMPVDFWRTWCAERLDRIDPAVAHARTSAASLFRYFGRFDASTLPKHSR